MYPRFIQKRVNEALTDTRVVLVSGPRQSGKTTLVRQIAAGKIPFLTLDDKTTLDAASADPVGFIRGLDRVVIDEVQRAPDLLLAIKTSVDTDPRPGRFLLTCSANLMTVPRVADSLAGRMEVVRLLPLAQAELHGKPSAFLELAFEGQTPETHEAVVGHELIDRVVAGGYPEALARSRWNRRQDWYLDYVEAIVQRDVRDAAQFEKLPSMPKLLRVLAQHSGQLVNHSGFGAQLGMNHPTTRKYTGVFESLYLLRSLQPWYSNALKRLTKTPKLHFLDSGLLAALRDVSPDRLRKDRALLGPLLETFVLAELLKLASWSQDRYEFSHFRDKERNEVDIVIEDRRGRVVGIEVKASATVSPRDFAGLRRLSDACSDRFVLGLVLHDHDQVVPFGERLLAAPVSALWSPHSLGQHLRR